jgi:hypothetical protein
METTRESSESSELVRALLERRLDAAGRRWHAAARAEVEKGAGDERFCALFSLASRYTPRGPLEPDRDEIARAGELHQGWNPERWTVLDGARVALILARRDLADPSGARAVEELFRYADVGELCAAYRSLAHLPMADRFTWRAGEGARTSIRSVFEATCCDTPFPARYFDAVAWRSAVIKALFVEAPAWRIHGLDARIDAELARMALDLADERRSAGRPVNPETWLCLGKFAGERGLASIERELASGSPRGRASAALALARAGERGRVEKLAASEKDPLVAQAIRSGLAGANGQAAFAALDPEARAGGHR